MLWPEIIRCSEFVQREPLVASAYLMGILTTQSSTQKVHFRSEFHLFEKIIRTGFPLTCRANINNIFRNLTREMVHLCAFASSSAAWIFDGGSSRRCNYFFQMSLHHWRTRGRTEMNDSMFLVNLVCVLICHCVLTHVSLQPSER